MIRFLLALECMLLGILAAGYIAFDEKVMQDGVGAKASAPAAIAAPSAPAKPAEPLADPSPTWRDADRRAIADDLLGPTVSAFLPPADAAQDRAPGYAPVPTPANAAASSLIASTGVMRAALPTGEKAELAPRTETGGDDRALPASDPPAARVAHAQRLLARLGYAPGAADGVPGERTEQAVRSYQRRIGVPSDGQVTAELVSRLRQDARALTRRRQSTPSGVTGRGGAEESSPGLLGELVGGFQRMVGHQFDSVRQPAEIRSYCRKHAETWIFDEGRRGFVYCGRIIAER